MVSQVTFKDYIDMTLAEKRGHMAEQHGTKLAPSDSVEQLAHRSMWHASDHAAGPVLAGWMHPHEHEETT